MGGRGIVALLLAGVLAPGCAFVSPVWEFSAGGDAGTVPPMDAAGMDAASGTDASPTVDAAGFDAGACTACAADTDDGCPVGFGCFVSQAASCTICGLRDGTDLGVGDTCASSMECARGLTCLSNRCVMSCESEGDCPSVEVCLSLVSGLPGLCIGALCSPTDPAPCGGGTACVDVAPMDGSDTNLGALCVTAGGAGPGEPCDAIGCLAQHRCLATAETTTPRCVAYCEDNSWCDLDNGEICGSLGLLDGVSLGICVRACTIDDDCPPEYRCATESGAICVPG